MLSFFHFLKNDYLCSQLFEQSKPKKDYTI